MSELDDLDDLIIESNHRHRSRPPAGLLRGARRADEQARRSSLNRAKWRKQLSAEKAGRNRRFHKAEA